MWGVERVPSKFLKTTADTTEQLNKMMEYGQLVWEGLL
jgi:hypothetical protein